MNIFYIKTGLIKTPPDGWGAVERLTWEYKKSLEKIGNNVEIKSINEIQKLPNTIVHAHLANHAIECMNKKIPYVFSLHDHHAEWLGKDSFVFKQNLDAIKNSIISFTHAEYLIDFFNETDKLFYIRHAADLDFFTPNYEYKEHRLLMIANNGLAGDSGFDRKGFRYGIEAAKKLNLPITIAGHSDNEKFFNIHKDLLDYDKLRLILTNPKDEEIKNLFQTHTIFLHPSMLEAGHPNLTLCEAASACLPIVGTYKGTKHFYGMWVLPNPSTQNLIIGIEETIKTYQYRINEMKTSRHTHSWDLVAQKLDIFYKNILKINEVNNTSYTRDKYIKEYNSL